MEPYVINQTDLNPEEVQQLINMGFAVEQGSEEWFEDRLGKVTASRVKDVVIRDRYGKPYKGYYDYMIELAIERVTEKKKRFGNKYTNHGNNYEAFVAGLYEQSHPDADVREVGFIEHPELAAGASCDRLVDDDGTLEIKAPNSDTLIRYMVSMIPEDSNDFELVKMLGLRGDEWKYYYEQIQMQLWITDRQWCDFSVGDPDMPENAQLIVKRVERDELYIRGIMEPAVVEFLGKVTKLERYLRMYGLSK